MSWQSLSLPPPRPPSPKKPGPDVASLVPAGHGWTVYDHRPWSWRFWPSGLPIDMGETGAGAFSPRSIDRESEALAQGHLSSNQARIAGLSGQFRRIGEGRVEEAEALTVRGLAEAYLEEVGPARDGLERAWRLQPNAGAASVLAAIYLSARDGSRPAYAPVRRSASMPEDFVLGLRWARGSTCVRRSYEEAATAFQEALDRLPGHVESQVGLADALVKSHRPRSSRADLKGVLRERSDDPRVLTLAAEVAFETGRDEDPPGSYSNGSSPSIPTALIRSCSALGCILATISPGGNCRSGAGARTLRNQRRGGDQPAELDPGDPGHEGPGGPHARPTT